MTSLGIPTYALFDGDGGFEARATANGKSRDKIDKETASHIAANRAVLKYFVLTEVDFPSAQVADNVAAFDDHLEAFLGANWPEWVASCQAVEQASGVTLSKNQLAYRAATLEAGGTIPEMLTQILAKVTGA